MNEIWKDVIGYEGIYMVSNLGRVKSLKFNKEKILKPAKNSNGYYIILLCNNNIKARKVHQLVAESFLGHLPCAMNLVVDHINDIKTDNRIKNLQIVTQRFNLSKKKGNYTSNYKGVSWNKKSNKWVSQIYINKKHKNLGLYINEYDAHLAYQNALNNLSL